MANDTPNFFNSEKPPNKELEKKNLLNDFEKKLLTSNIKPSNKENDNEKIKNYINNNNYSLKINKINNNNNIPINITKKKNPIINQIFKENVKFLNSKISGIQSNISNSMNKSNSKNIINTPEENIERKII